MIRNKLSSVFIVLLLLHGAASAQPPTNEQLIITAVKAAVEKEIPADPSSGVRIIGGGEGKARLFEQGIADGLRSKYGLVAIGQTGDSLFKNVNYDIQGFEFGYEKGSSRGFLRNRRVIRHFRCQLRITIQDNPDGVLLASRDIGIDISDQIEPSDLEYVKSRDIPELAPEPPGSGWSRIAEPALVIASVGALVYLFFANR